MTLPSAPTMEQLQEWAFMRGDYYGIPVPVDGLDVSLFPRHPRRAELETIYRQRRRDPFEDDDGEWKLVNSWSSSRVRGRVGVIENADGKREGIVAERFKDRPSGADEWRRLNMLFDTLVASDAWDLDAEMKAMGNLATRLTTKQRRSYFLTGVFLETSKRSGVRYLFRRCRPTIALSATSPAPLPLCALCLHPLAYYQETWAGAMSPSDEVLAHLLLMRTDEHRFWKKSNQHPAYLPEAGL